MSDEDRLDDLRDRLTDIVDELQQRRAAGGPTTTAIVGGMVLVSERESGPWISCASCSGVMVGHVAASVPASLDAAHRVRSSAGLPHSGGMTSDDVDRGLRGAYGVDLASVSESTLRDRLRSGYAAVAFLTYGSLPSHYRRWCPDFTGSHAVALAGWSNDRAGLFDPLATTGYGGEWISWADLTPALWSSGHLVGKMGGGDVRYANAAGYEDDSAQRLAVKAGTDWYYLDGARGGSFGSDADVVALGLGDGSTSTGYVVVIGTGGPYSDGSTRPTLVIVKSGTLEAAPEPLPPETVPPAGGDYDEGYQAGKRDAWDEWAAGLGIPDRPA